MFNKGKLSEIYNIGTSDKISNLELAKLILRKMKKDESYIDFVKGGSFNDKMYSVNAEKIKSL